MTKEPGRRERSVRAKQERIFAAAATLFDEQGYEAVTTQQIVDAADVGTGTLFRYGGSKAELLLKIMNSRFRELPDPPGHEDLEQSVQRLISPILTLALDNPENFAAYQREVLFGNEDSSHRQEALDGIISIETRLGEVLEADIGSLPEDMPCPVAGRVFLSTVYIELIRLGLGGATRSAVEAGINRRLRIVRNGLAADVAGRE